MAVQPSQEDSRLSPGLTLNLSSNNPFRNRGPSPLNSPADAPPRPVSRNPFLDVTYTNNAPQASSPDTMSFTTTSASSKPGLSADIFEKLSLDEKPKPSNGNGSSSMRRPPPPRSNTGSIPPPYSATASRGERNENIPPRGQPGHRPSRSQEEAMRARRAANGSTSSSRPRPTGELDIFADPVSPPRQGDRRRPRRNSDSSVISSKPLETEEERKRQERKRRERRHREREARDGKDGKGSKDKDGRPKKPERKLDVIDKLDVTSIYGTGLFHHDGPFDACNPHRNRQGSKRAPMSAFAKDSLNNVLGGSGPLNKKPDHATFLGNHDEQAFKEYSVGGAGQNGYEPYAPKSEANVQSAMQKVEPVHGDESLGLGTSTFLEGAPASRTAMQRREIEQQTSPTDGGLGRKKSVAQKIRGLGNSRREYGGRVTSPGVMSPNGMTSPQTPAFTPGGTEVNNNPFFNEFTKGDDGNGKKEALTFVEPVRTGRAGEPGSPKRPYGDRLERRVTSDGAVEQPAAKTGGGFLARVKSLKGGPRKPTREKVVPQSPILDL